MPQREYFGYGSIRNLKGILEKEGSRSPFLVTGKHSYESCGARSALEPLLIGYKTARFSDFSSNPKIEEVQKGFEMFKLGKYDIIIAVGGGSSIDVAKAIKLFYFNQTSVKVPLVAVPTTAGSGSEATHFIVYYIGKEKQSEGKPDLTLPDYVILDPSFTFSLPREIAASTAMDALAQAVEAYWSIYSTEESKEFSRGAIKLLMESLETAVNSNDRTAKANVMQAANLAGKAINIAKTTASHSVAYPITSYFGIPHGHAAALTLGEMLAYNSEVSDSDCNDARGAEYVRKTIGELTALFRAEDAQAAKATIKGLMQKAGLKARLSELGLKSEDIEIIIQNGFNPARVKNNPRLLTEDDLRKILKGIY
ncbi:hypothetical protein A3K73_01720 [Candidatus Pacearchaeota archaeon RBG_13_36_9]|nr:MAG: hypothetical protein A3K73_01720 [Candidatus Pacearchaeota archaeon RBG_13_36_9]